MFYYKFRNNIQIQKNESINNDFILKTQEIVLNFMINKNEI